jgi:hypothetical protein
LYAYAGNNPNNYKYESTNNQNQLASGLTSSYIANNSASSNGNFSNILGAFSAFSSAFGMFDMWSGYISSGLSGVVNFFGPDCFGFTSMSKYSSALKKFGIGMIVAGSIIDFGMSTYNNFSNYSTGQAIGATFMDAANYTLKGILTYSAGEIVGSVALSAGLAVGAGTFLALGGWGVALGVITTAGISLAGAIAIYYIGEVWDSVYEWIKEKIFN